MPRSTVLVPQTCLTSISTFGPESDLAASASDSARAISARSAAMMSARSCSRTRASPKPMGAVVDGAADEAPAARAAIRPSKTAAVGLGRSMFRNLV